MTFASSEQISDLKDIVYSQHLRIQELETEMQELREIVTKLDEMVTRNKCLGRLK